MINSVRNTVLSVLNKNNYGYISPSDFNLFAKQAQMELYEEYFSNYNKAITMENTRQVGTDYADISKPLAETLDVFLVYDFLPPVISLNAGPIDGKFQTPEAYMINRLTCWKLITSGSDGAISGFLNDPTKNFVNLGVKVGDFLIDVASEKFTTASAIITITNPNDTIIPNDDIFGNGNLYRIFSSTEGYDPERVTNGNIRMLNSSLLTKPNTLFPAYTQDESSIGTPTIGYPYKVINIYPNTISGYGALYCAYFRYPKDPKWTYITLSGGEPAFNASALDYQDFEMPLEDEYKLAMKILQYCGISIREGEVAQYAMAQEQHEQPSFSVQQ